MRSILAAVLVCVATVAAAEVSPDPLKQPATSQPSTEKAKADRRAAWRRESLAADKALTEKAVAERAAAEKAATEKLAAEKAAAVKLAADKAAAEKVAAEKAVLVSYAAGAGAAALAALVLAFIFWRRANAARARLAPITDIEANVTQLKAEEAKEEATVTELRKVREELEVTVKSLTEDLDVMDHGVYKPHFDFTTSEEYKRAMESVYAEKKAAISSGTAATCSRDWVVDGSKVEGRKMTKQNTKVMVRAFNSEVEAAVANVSWSNVKTMETRVLRAFEVINKNGESSAISIGRDYLALSLKELRLAFEYQQKKQDEKEEQRRIREEMREEEKVRQECEKAEKEAQDEALRYQKALARAQEELRDAHGAEMEAANAKVEELQRALAEALAKKARAIAQAQLTRMGHIYVISNIGSFGENVLKIGMTRRLVPKERIDELGDASVPFSFDIHAMIKADDAPKLERAFHKKFSERALNLVNPRKEFFRVNLVEVAAFAKSQGVTVEFTMLAEARQHRESEALRARPQVAQPRDSTPAPAQVTG
jgi:hypothetical protein